MSQHALVSERDVSLLQNNELAFTVTTSTLQLSCLLSSFFGHGKVMQNMKDMSNIRAAKTSPFQICTDLFWPTKLMKNLNFQIYFLGFHRYWDVTIMMQKFGSNTVIPNHDSK